MSDLMKLKLKSGKVNIKIKEEKYSPSDFSEPGMTHKQQLDQKYEEGFNEGYGQAKQIYENEMILRLSKKNEELSKVFAKFDEIVKNYDKEIENVIVQLAMIVAERVINREVNEKTIVVDVLKESLRKVVGANNVIIKLNPADVETVNSEGKKVFMEDTFSKVKFEADDRIEIGGCVVETDIGNVDARISAQINEIKKQIDTSFFSE